MIDAELREAARNFTYPTINGKVSVCYADAYTAAYYSKKYGKEQWREACQKAYIEREIGSHAVKW